MTNETRSSTQMNLGDAIVAACNLGGAVTPDRAMAADLAARHLERALVRGGNTRLIAALTDLARELRPTRSLRKRPFRDIAATTALAR